ncbi:DUF4118 domain-containing protein [Streptomyces sp. NPDC048392]|uniref:DUF4118 domain-containing protein n=1 Tax=Streptomyces sp. NPDC048392 TaxID=3365543 RepID=UPI0037245434
MGRGKLRIRLGAAPVSAGRTPRCPRRTGAPNGAPVRLGQRGRARTEVTPPGPEQMPRRVPEYRGAGFTELDPDAVPARRPEVIPVDEPARTHLPGVRTAERWQDVGGLPAAGTDVVSAASIQHPESLGGVVESIAGVRQRESVPDEVARRADRAEPVGMSPQALRRRTAHGHIHQPDEVGAALSRCFRFRPGSLTAPRELPPAVAAAPFGGPYPALASAVAGSLLLNWCFAPPVNRVTIADPRNTLALAVCVGVAFSAAVAAVVGVTAGRTHRAARLRAASEILALLAGDVLGGETGQETPLEQACGTFGVESAAPLERKGGVAPRTRAGRGGSAPPARRGARLGPAAARGFAEAMGGTLHAEDIPGGGLTTVLTLRAVGVSGPARHLATAERQATRC